jgi:NitT/TauT family transport system substrate-binding protein
VALENGYYEEEDLDVTIMPGGPDIAPPQVMAGGGADVIVDWMPSALAARERGCRWSTSPSPSRSGMMLTCLGRHRHFFARGPGQDSGHWFFGNEYPFLSWMSQLGIPPMVARGRDGAAGRASTSIRCCSGRPTASRP